MEHEDDISSIFSPSSPLLVDGDDMISNVVDKRDIFDDGDSQTRYSAFNLNGCCLDQEDLFDFLPFSFSLFNDFAADDSSNNSTLDNSSMDQLFYDWYKQDDCVEL